MCVSSKRNKFSSYKMRNKIEQYWPFWKISWQTGWPSSSRSRAPNNSAQWNPISIQLNISHRLLASSPTTEYSINMPADEKCGSQWCHNTACILYYINKMMCQHYYLVVVLHQLNNNTNVIAVIFYRDHSHDICSIFGIRILTVFIGQDQTGICFMNLFADILGGRDWKLYG